MKKLFIILCFAVFSFGGVGNLYAEEAQYVKVLYTSINIYSETNIENASVLKQEYYGTKLKLNEIDKIIGEDNLLYYSIEVTNVENVLDGDIDIFINSVLKEG